MGSGAGLLLPLSKADLERCLLFQAPVFFLNVTVSSLYFSHFSKGQQVLRGQAGKEKEKAETCL